MTATFTPRFEAMVAVRPPWALKSLTADFNPNALKDAYKYICFLRSGLYCKATIGYNPTFPPEARTGLHSIATPRRSPPLRSAVVSPPAVRSRPG